MKIKVESLTGIVADAFLERTEEALSVYINVSENDTKIDTIDTELNNDLSILSITFNFYNKASDLFDTVTVTAEDVADSNALHRTMFSCHSKSQFWFLFLEESSYEPNMDSEAKFTYDQR